VLAQGFSLGLIWPLVLGLIFCPLVAVLASLPPALHAVHTAPVNALSA
jgi:ABC-type lipoprotein release transport system permease subunit